MSAFLFTRNLKAIHDDTTESLESEVKYLEEKLKYVKWDALKQCTFQFDQAYGFRATLEMMKEELEARKIGKHAERVYVPGYNPADSLSESGES